MLVVDDEEDASTPPCLAIEEDDTEEPMNIRVAVQGKTNHAGTGFDGNDE